MVDRSGKRRIDWRQSTKKSAARSAKNREIAAIYRHLPSPSDSALEKLRYFATKCANRELMNTAIRFEFL
jgi:hypothetical protein